MAKYLPILGLFLLSSLVFCAQTPLEKFINASFEPDQSATAAELAGGFAVVSAGGVETYVVDSSGKAVKDRTALETVLANDAKANGGYDEKISSAQSFASAVSGAKQANEAKCMQYLGLNMYNCTDRQSCIVTCWAVPQCGIIINAGGFLEAMMEYNTGRLQFDSLILAYQGSLDAIKTDPSAIDQKLSALDEMGTLSENLSVNPIFLNRSDPQCQGGNATTCFEYCPKTDYSSARIDSQKQNLQALKTVLAGIAAQPARADAILAKSNANDLYLSTRHGDFEAFRLKMNGDIADLKSKNATFSKSVKDPEVRTMLSSLFNLSESIVADADAGYYRRAMGRESGYDAAESTVSDRMESGLAAYYDMTAELSSIEANINKSAWMIGNGSAAQYSLQLAAIKQNATAPATVQQISAARAAMAELGVKLAQQVASAATENPQAVAGAAAGAAASQAKGSIPCLPAFAILAMLCFASAGRPRRK